MSPRPSGMSEGHLQNVQWTFAKCPRAHRCISTCAPSDAQARVPPKPWEIECGWNAVWWWGGGHMSREGTRAWGEAWGGGRLGGRAEAPRHPQTAPDGSRRPSRQPKTPLRPQRPKTAPGPRRPRDSPRTLQDSRTPPGPGPRMADAAR